MDVTLFSFCPFNTTSFKIEIQVGSTSVLDYYYLSGLVAQKFISFRGPCIFLLLLSVLVKLSILCCNQLDAPVIENFISTRAILCVHVDLSNLAFVDDFFAFAVTETQFCDHHVLLWYYLKSPWELHVWSFIGWFSNLISIHCRFVFVRFPQLERIRFISPKSSGGVRILIPTGRARADLFSSTRFKLKSGYYLL